MRVLREKNWYLPSMACAVIVLLGGVAVCGDAPDRAGRDLMSLKALSGDINDLDWEKAGAFEFVWDSVELSIKVSNPRGDVAADCHVPVLTISGLVDIVDTNNVATIDISSVGIWEALDENGQVLGVPTTEASYQRAYEEYDWFWDETGVHPPQKWFPFTITFELSPDPNGTLPSSISAVGGYIYALFADTVLNVDVPFDPNFGCLEVEEAPDLMICVNPSTSPRFHTLGRPLTLYSYSTAVKSKAGTQILGVRGFGCTRFMDYVDYAVIRTSLFNSQENLEYVFRTQSVSTPGVRADGGGGSDRNATDAYCSGTASPLDYDDNWDMIRHVVVLHPVEVKIPFVLSNIPVPSVQAIGK
jgi:hypothetical protein